MVSWSADSRDLVNSSKFTIRESFEERGGVVLIRSTLLVGCIEPENAAQYACHVTTGTDRTSASFTVDVQGMIVCACVCTVCPHNKGDLMLIFFKDALHERCLY